MSSAKAKRRRCERLEGGSHIRDFALDAADNCAQVYSDASVSGHTLYYMPHCEQFVYDGVLAACARLRALHRVALLGNSFAEYAEREDLRPATQRKRGASALLQLQPLVTGASFKPCCSDSGHSSPIALVRRKSVAHGALVSGVGVQLNGAALVHRRQRSRRTDTHHSAVRVVACRAMGVVSRTNCKITR